MACSFPAGQAGGPSAGHNVACRAVALRRRAAHPPHRVSDADMLRSVFLSAYSYYTPSQPSLFRYSAGGVSWAQISRGLDGWRYVCSDKTDAQAVCAYDKAARKCYVAFRGTDSRADAIADISVRRMRLPGAAEDRALRQAHVHAGFLWQYESISRPIRQFVEECRDAEQVVLTGHSLGGALAVIACHDLCTARPGLGVRCIAFGCPRVGDEGMRQRLKTMDVLRVVNERDPVAAMPSRLRWVHCGRALCLRKGAAPLRVEDDPLLNMLRLPNVMRVSDHRVQGYADAVVRAFGDV